MGSCSSCLGNAAENTTKNLADNNDLAKDQSNDEVKLESEINLSPAPKVTLDEAKHIQGAVRGFLTRKQLSGPLFNAKDARSWFNIEKLYPKADKPISEVQDLLVGIMESKLKPFKVKKPDDGIETKPKPAMKLNDGTVYEGEWDKNGNQHGIGTMVKEDGSKIVGLFKAGKLDGLARLIDSSGLVYEAEFKEGEMNGNGKIQNKSGGKFDGELVNGKIHGKGAEEWPDGTKYDGEYREGKRHGKGNLVLADGSTYDGNFKDGAMSGKGELKFKNGSSYKGSFRNNKMEGKGIFRWPDGKKYDGEWKDGVQHGDAFYTFKNKEGKMETRKSRWENGTRVEWLDKN
jgi:hypothetical protein